MSDFSDNDSNLLTITPPDIIADAKDIVSNLLPEKSKMKYMKEYEIFMQWKREKKAVSFSENVLLSYFKEKAAKYKPSSLWAIYSMLKSTLLAKNNVNIKDFNTLTAFLKRKSSGFRSKKSRVLTATQIDYFLQNAPNDTYLGHKVVLILGVNGACRCQELVNMTTDDLETHGNIMLVKIPDTKTKIQRSFVISDQFYDILKTYKELRPNNLTTKRFLLQFRKNKYIKQVMGKNKISSIPKEIATFLKLPNPQEYTGHCFRRTSTTLLADSGADLTTIKRHGGWKSSTVAEGYIEDSIQNKKRISEQIQESINVHPDFNYEPQPSTSTAPIGVFQPATCLPPKLPKMCRKIEPTVTEPSATHMSPQPSTSTAPVDVNRSDLNMSQTNIKLPGKNITLTFNNCNNVNITF